MSKKNGKAAETVVCDFSDVNRRWGQRWIANDNEIRIALAAANGAVTISDEDAAMFQERFVDDEDGLANALEIHEMGERSVAMERINSLMDERDDLIARVLREVPRKWLVSDSPRDIDWSDADNIKEYVLDGAYNDLVAAVRDSRANLGNV